MRHLVFLLLAVSGLRAQNLDCKAQQDRRNGSVLCVQLKVLQGRIAVASTTFAATAAFGNDKAIADDLGIEASRAIATLDSPCLLTMTRDQRRRYRRKELNDPETLRICQESFENWQKFTEEFLTWAEHIGRAPVAENVLSAAGVFRPLLTLYFRTPLLWDDVLTLNEADGRIDFFVADRFDPASASIEIENAPDDQTRDRRLAGLRRHLNPLRNTVFCHQRIRAEIESYYAKQKAPKPEFIRIDPNGPLIQIRESSQGVP